MFELIHLDTTKLVCLVKSNQEFMYSVYPFYEFKKLESKFSDYDVKIKLKTIEEISQYCITILTLDALENIGENWKKITMSQITGLSIQKYSDAMLDKVNLDKLSGNVKKYTFECVLYASIFSKIDDKKMFQKAATSLAETDINYFNSIRLTTANPTVNVVTYAEVILRFIEKDIKQRRNISRNSNILYALKVLIEKDEFSHIEEKYKDVQERNNVLMIQDKIDRGESMAKPWQKYVKNDHYSNSRKFKTKDDHKDKKISNKIDRKD